MLVLLVIISCKTSFNVQIYRFIPIIDCDTCNLAEINKILSKSDRKSIVLKNDSILEYWKFFGGLGSVTTVKYFLKNNLITIDSLDIYRKTCPEEFTNIKLVYSADSLINDKTREIYYNQKYIEKKEKKFVEK